MEQFNNINWAYGLSTYKSRGKINELFSDIDSILINTSLNNQEREPFLYLENYLVDTFNMVAYKYKSKRS